MIREGDWVQIKSFDAIKRISVNQNVEQGYLMPSGVWFTPQMEKYCGLIARVGHVRRRGIGSHYNLDLQGNPIMDRYVVEDRRGWIFTEEMVRKVEDV